MGVKLPTFSSACDLADRIPAYVASFLDLDKRVGRRFREETINDLLVAAILQLPQPDIFVMTPPEIKTGGDFDIIIVDKSVKDAVQYRIQAKKMTVHEADWTKSSYKELCHPHNTGQQSSTLIRSAAHEGINTVPLYGFYNPARACAAAGGMFSGVELADGYEIRNVVATLVRAKAMGRRPPLKRVQHLQQYFFPLSTILCPAPSLHGRDHVPTPRESLAATNEALRQSRLRRGRYPWRTVPRLRVDDQIRLIEGPEEIRVERVTQIPDWFRRIVETRREEKLVVTSETKRPRVVLTSSPA